MGSAADQRQRLFRQDSSVFRSGNYQLVTLHTYQWRSLLGYLIFLLHNIRDFFFVQPLMLLLLLLCTPGDLLHGGVQSEAFQSSLPAGFNVCHAGYKGCPGEGCCAGGFARLCSYSATATLALSDSDTEWPRCPAVCWEPMSW